MSLQSRSEILTDIATELDCSVFSLVNGDRENLQTNLAPDVLRRLPRHLESLGRSDRLAVVLYTRGGDTNTPWPLVNFLRAYCDELIALIPFWCHSAGTLIALGADRIHMTRFATVSPIDPTVANAFNPQDPTNPQNRIPIAVEDVMAFLQLADQADANPETKRAAFVRMADTVHPLALGNVKRSIEQIRQLGTKMVQLHSPDRSDGEIQELVHRLTTAMYSHMHLINRVEARSIGLPVEDTSDTLENLLIAYDDELKNDLALMDKFDPAALLRATDDPQVSVTLERAYLETPSTCDGFVTRATVSQQPIVPGALPPGVPAPVLPTTATVEVTSEGWEQLA